MFCKNCGVEIVPGAEVCYNCGAPTGVVSTNNTNTNTSTNNSNSMAIAGFICAFFFPLLGLIFGCMGLSRSKQCNGEGRGLSIAAIIISSLSFVIVLIYAIAMIGLMGAAAGGALY